ncbi:MAG: class II fructose-bisphosphatase [bacterium]|nr:class II fructose-bisphosphatase [bacterium]
MDRHITFELGRICERAALACAPFVGRGDRHGADKAATEAMRQAFDDLGIRGTIVIGEGERDEAPMLYIGEEVGAHARHKPHAEGRDYSGSAGFKLQIAVDPLEGTNLCANGLPGAITVIAATQEGEGTLLAAPDVYMEKIAVGEACVGRVDLTASVAENLRNIASALEKPVEEVTVVALDRPRHEKLIDDVRKAGARIRLITDGDVAGALAAAMPENDIDVLMGIGAAPEGVLAAAGLRAMRGQIQGRLVFKNDAEKERARTMGVSDPDHIFSTEELASGNVMFAACGVTTGEFLRGVRYTKHGAYTHSVVMRSATHTIRWIEAEHHFGS